MQNMSNSDSFISHSSRQAAVAVIEKGLINLEYLLNNKISAQDIMMLVHGRLHPSLQLAYNLKLKQ